MKSRIQVEDALKHLHECDYRSKASGPESLAGALSCDLVESTRLLSTLQSKGLASLVGGTYQLTDTGRDYAREVVRAHRLYETYLARDTGLSEAEWHRQAEKMEHNLSGSQVGLIAKSLGYPRYDPHGDPIPTAGGELPPSHGTSILECPIGWEGRITHLEDEPHAFYQELIDAGLAPGMRLKIHEPKTDVLRLNVEGRITQFGRAVASNLMVTAFAANEAFDPSICRLSDLQPGEAAAILELSPACRGAERNRLLDLGLVPGTQTHIVLSSPSGSPIAYYIRGATIALRREQADKVLIRKTESQTA